jgi:hypothetical protein
MEPITMGQIVYGPGALFLTPLGVVGATPINVGYVNEFSFDEDGETKELYGQMDYPVAARRGTIKGSGKMKNALMSAQALNAFNGCTIVAGTQIKASLGEAATIPAAAPFTVVGANAANFNSDLGPVYASNLVPFSNQGTGTLTAAGKYTSANGTYTFDSLDGGLGVFLNYSYLDSTHGGFTKITTAKTIGLAPTVMLDYVTTDPVGGTYYFRAYCAIMSKLSRSFKITDFMMPELDFMVMQNAAGQVYEESFSPSGA